MTKILIEINNFKHELEISEARRVWQELSQVFTPHDGIRISLTRPSINRILYAHQDAGGYVDATGKTVIRPKGTPVTDVVRLSDSQITDAINSR